MLRQGKLDGAIEAYVRLVEDRPSDWNSVDALGDPSLGAGDVERAIAQFTRVADQFFSDSSLQKAAALYKRALEAEDEREPAPRRLGGTAERRGPEAGSAAARAAEEVGDTLDKERLSDRTAAVPPEITVPPEAEALPEVSLVVLSEIATPLEAEVLPDVSPEVSPEVLSEVARPLEVAAPLKAEAPPEVLPEVPPEIAGPLEVEAPPEVLPEVDVPIEVDLSNALDGLAAASAETVGVAHDGPSQPGLEGVRVADVPEHVAALGSATREARSQFMEAAELGRRSVSQGDLRASVEWLERAAEASPTSPEEGFAVLYDLAVALDRLGETARALAVLIDLDLDSGGYQDVRVRIDRLMVAPAGSPRK